MKIKIKIKFIFLVKHFIFYAKFLMHGNMSGKFNRKETIGWHVNCQ